MINPFTHACTHHFTHSFLFLPTYSLIHSFSHVSIHPLISFLPHAFFHPLSRICNVVKIDDVMQPIQVRLMESKVQDPFTKYYLFITSTSVLPSFNHFKLYLFPFIFIFLSLYYQSHLDLPPLLIFVTFLHFDFLSFPMKIFLILFTFTFTFC